MSMFKVPNGKMFILPPAKNAGPFYTHKSSGSALFNPKRQNVCGCPICAFNQSASMSKPKLVPIVLPEAARGKDFKTLAKEGKCKYWTSLTEEALSKHGSTSCFYCTARPEVAQEVWHFDDQCHKMTVADLVPVCRHCQMAINIADTEDKPEFPSVVQHMCEVSGIKKSQVGELIREAFQLWEERSQYRWTVSHGVYAHFLHQPGQLPDDKVFDNMPVVKDGKRVPSQTDHVNYLHVKRDVKKIIEGGACPVFILSGTMSQIDSMWPLIANMTTNGHLAAEALASTRRYNEGKTLLSPTGFIIIVLDKSDPRYEIEQTLNVLFKDTAASIVFTEGKISKGK